MPVKIKVRADGLKELAEALRGIENIPPETIKAMAEAGAKPLEEATVFTAGTMLTGPYYEGDVAASVKAKKASASGVVNIKFEGSSHGNRNAEIAFVNFYGTKRAQPARPFITAAEEMSGQESADKVKEVIDKFLKSKGL